MESSKSALIKDLEQRLEEISAELEAARASAEHLAVLEQEYREHLRELRAKQVTSPKRILPRLGDPYETDLGLALSNPGLSHRERLVMMAEANPDGLVNAEQAADTLLQVGVSQARRENLQTLLYRKMRKSPGEWELVDKRTFRYLGAAQPE